jgi:hypothetical protein
MSKHLAISVLDDIDGTPMHLDYDGEPPADERDGLGSELFAAEFLPRNWCQVTLTMKTANPEYAAAQKQWTETLNQAVMGMAMQGVREQLEATGQPLDDNAIQQAALQLLQNAADRASLEALAEQQLGGPPDIEPTRLREEVLHFKPQHFFQLLRSLPGVDRDGFIALATGLGLSEQQAAKHAPVAATGSPPVTAPAPVPAAAPAQPAPQPVPQPAPQPVSVPQPVPTPQPAPGLPNPAMAPGLPQPATTAPGLPNPGLTPQAQPTPAVPAAAPPRPAPQAVPAPSGPVVPQVADMKDPFA